MSWCVFEFVVFICPLFFSPFSLTVTDSDGAQSSTQATLSVSKAMDYRPVANAGPNQVITLPRNVVTLHGNQSADDHEPLSYEWSLSPESKGKVVAMQVREEHQGWPCQAHVLPSNQGDSRCLFSENKVIPLLLFLSFSNGNSSFRHQQEKGNSSLPS